jgi:hypothetical protein
MVSVLTLTPSRRVHAAHVRAAERRRLAELEGPKPRQVSKKDLEALKAAKRGQGDRTAKTVRPSKAITDSATPY